MKVFRRDTSFMQRAWEIQGSIEEKQKRLGKGRYGRVLKMARKPTDEEYNKTSKITGAGIVIIGAIGFVVYLVATQLAPMVAEALGLS